MSGTAQKLTKKSVARIMRLLANGHKQCYIAMREGVSQPTISQLKNGKTWRIK